VTLRRLWHLIGLALLAATVWGSLGPPPDSPLRFPFEDKAWHLLAYFCLAGWYGMLRPADRRWRWRVAVACALLGLLLEGLQHFVPGRLPDLGDALANTGGALLGLLWARSRAGRLLERLERLTAGSGDTRR